MIWGGKFCSPVRPSDKEWLKIMGLMKSYKANVNIRKGKNVSIPSEKLRYKIKSNKQCKERCF